MEALAITNSGIEDVAAQEITKLTGSAGSKCDVCEGLVSFNTKKFEDLFLMCYKLQSARKVILLLKKFKCSSIKDIEKEISKVEFKEWIDNNTRFVVECESDSISTQEVRETAGEVIKNLTKAEISFKSPDVIVFAYITGDTCYLGIDFGREDLAKRDYKVFLTSDSLKANLAFALAQLCGYKKDKVLLDPFCNDGAVVIEAALSAAELSPHFYSKDKFNFMKIKRFKDFDFEKFFEGIDKAAKPKQEFAINAFEDNFGLLQNAKKNAKIAGVVSCMRFSRTESDWIELKFKENSVDIISALPTQMHHFTEPGKLQKKYNELFYQADYVLAKDGVVGLITRPNIIDMLKNAAETHKFRLDSERPVMQGKQDMSILIFSRAK
jgi:putative N6-adenine-specific DNA methylase